MQQKRGGVIGNVIGSSGERKRHEAGSMGVVSVSAGNVQNGEAPS